MVVNAREDMLDEVYVLGNLDLNDCGVLVSVERLSRWKVADNGQRDQLKGIEVNVRNL